MQSVAKTRHRAKRPEICRRIARRTILREPCALALEAPTTASAGAKSEQGEAAGPHVGDRWWWTHYRNGHHVTRSGTRAEAEAAAKEEWAFIIDPAYGNNVVRRPEGDVIVHPGGLPEVSDSAAVMLFLLMGFPGRWHDPYTISRQPLCGHLLQDGNCPQCTKRLRRVFGEGGKPGCHEVIRPFYFILTRPYPHAVRWNAEATFIVIEAESQLGAAFEHPGHVFPAWHLTFWRVRGLPIPPSIRGKGA